MTIRTKLSKWYLKWRLEQVRDEIWEADRTLDQIEEEIMHLEASSRSLRYKLSDAIHIRQKLEKGIASLEQAE